MLRRIRHTLELIKFSHTLFALPFALSAYFVATTGKLQPKTLGWVLLCLISARTSAMAFNRWADAKFDALNPRTQNRHLPAGLLSSTYVLGLVIFSSLVFILGAFQLNTLAGALALPCLALLLFYSLTKRFTDYTQFFLGLALGMAPIGAHIAVTGSLSWSPVILGIAVCFWVSGFDLLYALQDLNFDQSQGLHTLTVKWGMEKTFRVSLILHLGFFILLALYGQWNQLGWLYWIGWLITGGLLLWQHKILDHNLKKIDMAFFTANGLLSLMFFGFVLADQLWK